MTARRWKFWGWGYEDTRLSEAEERQLMAFYGARFSAENFERLPIPEITDIPLHTPRLAEPAKLAAVCSTGAYDRLDHTYG